MPVLHVAMPVFDEGQTLSRIVDRVMGAPLPPGWSLRLVMVDDGSRPEAARVAREARERGGSSAELLVHPRNRGKGAALMTAFDHVLAGAADADAVLVQDADLEYDPADYPALLGALVPGTGAVFGNRWAGTRPAGAWRRLHAAANGFLTWASDLATGLGVRDMECCYKLLRVPVLREVRPWLTEERFGIEPQVAAALARAKVRVAEVPVRYAPRGFAEGKKIRWTDGVRALWVIARERARRAPG
ncbi:MAG: glycosyltransferase family 2 protein [Phycisphaerales bacterium]|nr:glycosyltransferase family 2 protein [Phycisphaerales bacterium]